MHEHRLSPILAAFKLVADDGHLGREVFRLDEAVDHAVGFELDREFEIVVAGRQRLVIVRAVEPRRAVVFRPAILQRFRDVGKRRRSFEDHVLQQVSHARLAVPFVTRSDKDRQINRDGRLRLIGEEQHFQPVVEPQFRDPFNRSNQLRSFVGGVCR